MFGILGAFLYPPDKKEHATPSPKEEKASENSNETTVKLEEIADESQPKAEAEEKITLRTALVRYLILLKKPKVWCLLLFSTLFMTANTILFALYGIWFEEKYGFTVEQIGLASISIGVSEFLGSTGTMSIAGDLDSCRKVM